MNIDELDLELARVNGELAVLNSRIHTALWAELEANGVIVRLDLVDDNIFRNVIRK